MELKPGYKQTEAGIIPIEWEIQPLGDVIEFLDGRRRPVKDSDRTKMKGTIPYYGASGIVDYVNQYIFDENLILLGEDGENILSRNCKLAFQISGKTWVNNHAHVLRPKAWMDIGYLAELLESLNYSQFNTGTAQPKLNKQVCSNIPIVCPPLPEQRAIAAALSDTDALLSSLDRLLAKKRDIKQAVMQQLLTGKQRLPGFSGEWEYEELGNLVRITKGQQLNRAELSSSTGFAAWNGGIEPSGFTDTWNTTENTITISEGGNSCGFVGFVRQKFWCGGHCYALLNVSSELDRTFLYFLLKSQQSLIMSLRMGSGLPNIQRKYLSELPLLYPTLSEQVVIAAVLSDMDAEIDALQQRRDKTRAVKQGMMQELLTGRTRLL